MYVGTGSPTTCTSYVAEASVYGKRDGYITGLSVISKENQRSSLFRNTPGWKTGCVHDVEMLSRSAMYKPSASSLKYFKFAWHSLPLWLFILFPSLMLRWLHSYRTWEGHLRMYRSLSRPIPQRFGWCFFCALIVIQNKNIFPWGRRRNVDLASNHAQFSPSHSLHLHHRRPSRVRWVACTCCFGGVVVHGIGKDSSKSYYNIIVKNDTFVGWRDFQNFVIHWPWKITVQCSTYSLSLHSCEEIPQ